MSTGSKVIDGGIKIYVGICLFMGLLYATRLADGGEPVQFTWSATYGVVCLHILYAWLVWGYHKVFDE